MRMQPDEIAWPIYSGWLVPWMRYCVSLPPEYKYSPRAPIGFCGPPVTKAGIGPSRACSPGVGVHDGHSSLRPTVAMPLHACASSPTVRPYRIAWLLGRDENRNM